jgi:hypothetical protein
MTPTEIAHMLAGKGSTEGGVPAGGIQALGDGGIVVGGSQGTNQGQRLLGRLE